MDFDQEEKSDFDIWNICSEISCKSNWYSKVFNQEIVDKWQAEIMEQNPKSHPDNFLFAVNLMRASAQGTKHQEKCEWLYDFDEEICEKCHEDLSELVQKNPSEYDWDGVDTEEFSRIIDEIICEENPCTHVLCKCIPANSELHQYIEYTTKGVLNKTLHDKCKQEIHAMMDRIPVDWHPGSNDKVRDLIHPSLYCYVAGKSLGLDGKPLEPIPKDESRKYQWLPSKFHVKFSDKKYTTSVESYINNLDTKLNPDAIPLIEQVFSAFVPNLERVLHKSLRNRDVQVIVKMGHVVLAPENPDYPGGSWHIEGMPQEKIAATCLHYVDVKNISDSFLEFRKPVIVGEDLDYPQNSGRYTTHHYGIEPDSHHEGHQNRYLGLIKCSEGASVVFPNTLQHRVKEFGLEDKTEPGLRTIIAFFVVDPDHPIIDTSQVPPQQGIFSRKLAEYYRTRLMFHRKYFVNQINREVFMREYSLCEH